MYKRDDALGPQSKPPPPPESSQALNMSGTIVSPTAQTKYAKGSDALMTTSKVENNQPVSFAERPPNSVIILNPKTTQQRNRGHWESWPTGRAGPFVSETRLSAARGVFRYNNIKRDQWSRTEEKVFHVAEFSASGRGEFDV